jgi:hypothetical protein
MFFVIVPSHEAGGVSEFFGPFETKDDARSWASNKMPAIADATDDKGWTDWFGYCICEPESAEDAWQRVIDAKTDAQQSQ